MCACLGRMESAERRVSIRERPGLPSGTAQEPITHGYAQHVQERHRHDLLRAGGRLRQGHGGRCHDLDEVRLGCQTAEQVGEYSGPVAAEHAALQDIEPLDPGRALVDREHPGVPQHALDRPFLDVAGTAEHLDGCVRVREGRLGAGCLGERQKDAGTRRGRRVAGVARIDRGRGLERQQTRCLRTHAGGEQQPAHLGVVDDPHRRTGGIATLTALGGIAGLGEVISTKMADAGYKVAVTFSPGNTKHAEWVAGMKARSYDIAALACDVADTGSCAKAVAEVVAKAGPVDVLVNNAGITRDMTFKKMDKVNWVAVMRTNLDSLFNMSKQVVDAMVDRGWGRVINVSSVNGSKGAFGQTNYSAAKGGVHGFSKALALEVAKRGVTVNTSSPGYIGTKMVTAIPKDVLDSKILPHIPVGRLGKPEEVAGLIIYLASNEAAFVTGANIAINGGQPMQ